MASPEAQKIISNKVKERKGLTFLGKNGLNNLISELIKNGQLLPLSLKKSDGQVNIVKVNFSRASEERIINKVSYGGVKPETFKKWIDPDFVLIVRRRQ